ncbi:MAG: cytochrome c [Chitinophagaceae bacterium]|nr:MAG: cytochrome c [Chitinophagaceae bacterium]
MKKKAYLLITLFFGLLLGLYSCGGESNQRGVHRPEAPNTANLTAQQKEGLRIYDIHCKTCHGAKGNLKLSGASDLTISVLSMEESIEVISEGRGAMMPFKIFLNESELEAVASYVHLFRN